MLFTPGPVKLLDEIRIAMSKEMISHREESWNQIHMSLVDRFKKYTNAEEAYIISGSGTLGNEMNLANALRKDDRIICLSNGEFGERLPEIAQIYSKEVILHQLDSTKAWNLERTKELIDDGEKKGASVLGMVYNETSNGTKNSVKDICNYAKKKGLRTIVDGVSAWPATELDMKTFGVDFFCTGSQKAIGSAPGLVMVSVSKDGADFNEKRTDIIANYYVNMKKHRKFVRDKKQTPFTPAIPLYYALDAAFSYMDRTGGIEGSIKRHKAAAEFCRKRLTEMNQKIVAEPGYESNTITAFWSDKTDLIKKEMRKRYDIEIAKGMGKEKEKMIRICHIGNFKNEELALVLDCIEKILK